MSETQKRKAAKKKLRSQNQREKSEQLLDNLGSFNFAEATVVCSLCQKNGEECQCPKEETIKDNEKLARIIDYTDNNLNKLVEHFSDLGIDISSEEEETSDSQENQGRHTEEQQSCCSLNGICNDSSCCPVDEVCDGVCDEVCDNTNPSCSLNGVCNNTN